MEKIRQFRYADHLGMTVVYPRELPSDRDSFDHPLEVKFAPVRVGKSPIQVIYPVQTLEDLSPKVIKAKTDEILAVLTGRNPPSSNSILNGIVRGLGLDKDWVSYKTAYEEKLLPFLDERSLITARNLLVNEYDGVIHLKYRNIADRLFASDRPMPSRLFTGIGFNYWNLLELACARSGLSIVDFTNRKQVFKPPFDVHIPPANYVINGEGVSFSFLNILGIFDNLIGDQLCKFSPAVVAEEFVAKLYNTTPGEDQKLQNNLATFHELIKSSQLGWVEIISYNENFAFLRDGTGGYDFVFKGLRDNSLTVSSRDERDTVVANDEDRTFEVWSYFNYGGWRERDEHKAEQEFYADGGAATAHPQSTRILHDYLTSQGKNIPSQIKPMSGVHLTDLITIRAYRRYLHAEGKFGKAQGRDPWLYANGNREEDENLPVSVTWEDAVDYVRWENAKGKRRCRLPTEDEYRQEFSSLIPAQISNEDVEKALSTPLIEFINAEGDVYEGHPPYMHPDDFGKLAIRYRQPLPMQGGVVRSAYFGEWLEPEGAAINGLFFCAQFCVGGASEGFISPALARLPVDTTGKYKGIKIGFRLAILE